MIKNIKIKFVCCVVLSLTAFGIYPAHVFSQANPQQLTATILHLDSAFWKAYNNCDTAHFIDFVTDDVEFYHDKGGITSDAKSLIYSLNKNICGNERQHIRREAIAGSVNVYPMQNGDKIYGAIISGKHSFYVTEKGGPEYHSGDANFTQLWILKEGAWKMSRILSYNHHAPEYENTRKVINVAAGRLNALTGRYKSAQSGVMTLTTENKVLVLKGENNSFILYPETDTLFFTKDRDLVFQFIKDKNGRPLKIIVKENKSVADELIFEK